MTLAANHVQINELVESLKEEGLYEEAVKIEFCGQRYSGFICGAGCLEGKATPITCGLRICPTCSARSSKDKSKIVAQIFKSMTWPMMITLTIPSVKVLTKEVLDNLRKAFTKLRHRKEFSDQVTGGYYSIEITHTQAGWHPHIHFLADCQWFDVFRLSSLWQECGGGKIVDVRRADKNSVKEVAKYHCKSLQLIGQGLLRQLLEAIKGKRLSGTVGQFYGEDTRLKKELFPKTPMKCPCCDAEMEYVGKIRARFLWKESRDRSWRINTAGVVELQQFYLRRLMKGW